MLLSTGCRALLWFMCFIKSLFSFFMGFLQFKSCLLQIPADHCRTRDKCPQSYNRKKLNKTLIRKSDLKPIPVIRREITALNSSIKGLRLDCIIFLFFAANHPTILKSFVGPRNTLFARDRRKRPDQNNLLFFSVLHC